MMRILLLIGIIAFFCPLHAQTPAPAGSPSLEQRVADLEAYVNNAARGADAVNAQVGSNVAGPGPGHHHEAGAGLLHRGENRQPAHAGAEHGHDVALLRGRQRHAPTDARAERVCGNFTKCVSSSTPFDLAMVLPISSAAASIAAP